MPKLSTVMARVRNAVAGDSADLTAPATPSAADIAARISATQAELDALVPEHAAVAFQAVAGDPEADARENELAERIAGLESLLRRLRVALAVAKQREEAEATRVRLENQAALRARTAKLIQKRSACAADIEAGLAQAAKGFRKLHEYNMRIRAAFPSGSELGGTMLDDAALQRAVAVEAFRQSGRSWQSTEPAFPGAMSPNEHVRYQPERIPSLASVIEGANAHAVEIMTSGKVAVIAPAASVTEDDGENTNV